MNYLFLSTALFLLGILSYKIYIYISLRYNNIVNHSNLVKNPKIVIGEGGVIFCFYFLIFISILNFSDLFEFKSNVPRFYMFILSFTLLSILSFIDDKINIHQIYRILAQILLTWIALPALNFPITFLPFKLDTLLAIFVWISFINTSNFIDGLNGMLGFSTISFFLGNLIIIDHYNLYDHSIFFISLISIPLIISFIFFNYPKAKIFAGDVGSVTFGFIMGYITLYLLSLKIYLPVIFIFTYPILDVAITLIDKTLIRKKYPWERLFDYFFLAPVINYKKKHSFVVNKIILINILNIILLKLYLIFNNFFLIIILLTCNLLLIKFFNKFKVK